MTNKQTTKRDSTPKANRNRVTMTALDEKLAEWVGIARSNGPVIVDRYESPWVCIVSYLTWHEINNLKSYISDENHALVSLREAIDNALAFETAAMAELAGRCESGVPPKFIIRAWVLQIVYSLTRAEVVRESLNYNMLWRWFVGYTEVWEALPDAEKFIRDIEMVSTDARIVNVVYQYLSSNELSHPEIDGFCVNFGLLNTLRAHNVDAAEPDSNPPPSAPS